VNREYKFFIQDMLKAISNIEEFIGRMDFNDFFRDEKTKSAVVQKIETIGEASKHIPKEIKEKYSDLPWKEMARIRDKITHFYFGINYKIVWEVVKERFPEIKSKIEIILKDLEEQNA